MNWGCCPTQRSLGMCFNNHPMWFLTREFRGLKTYRNLNSEGMNFFYSNNGEGALQEFDLFPPPRSLKTTTCQPYTASTSMSNNLYWNWRHTLIIKNFQHPHSRTISLKGTSIQQLFPTLVIQQTHLEYFQLQWSPLTPWLHNPLKPNRNGVCFLKILKWFWSKAHLGSLGTKFRTKQQIRSPVFINCCQSPSARVATGVKYTRTKFLHAVPSTLRLLLLPPWESLQKLFLALKFFT